jgi:GntR family transcriptional regulator / MocR family aminotransferase
LKRATSSPELLLDLAPETEVPLRLQVERGLRQAIRSGRLPAGALLPSTRVLATDLGISRGVVLNAYEQLLAEGYLVAERGSATRVAERCVRCDEEEVVAPNAITTYKFDFRPGVPDPSLFPRTAWLNAIRRTVSVEPAPIFDYPDPRGIERARSSISAYLNRARAAVTRSDRIVLCNGFAQGVRLVAQALRERGVKKIAVEDPIDVDQDVYLSAEGLQQVRVSVDEDGLRVDVLSRSDAGAVMVTPAHQYPTGAVMSPERRTALLEWAVQRHAIIIEDDYDAEYRYDREPIGSLQGRVPDSVAYVGTTSKMLSPALRLGWIALPPQLMAAVTRIKFAADRGSPALDQLALADFLDRGELDKHLRKTRQIYRRRRDALVDALHHYLPKLRVRGVAAGLHLMLDLDRSANEKKIVEQAARESMRVVGSQSFRTNQKHQSPALVLGYGRIDESRIAEGVSRLAGIIARARP